MRRTAGARTRLNHISKAVQNSTAGARPRITHNNLTPQPPKLP